MRIKRISSEFSEPEKIEDTYIIRSSERVDVRPGETVFVETGLEYLAYKTDNAVIYGPQVEEQELYSGRGYDRLTVRIQNSGKHTISVYPDQIIAFISIDSAKRYKTASLSSKAQTTVEAQANVPGCKSCG
jgi:hypothetical protein